MVTFEVFLNGKRVCVAGIADPGVLTTILSFASANRKVPELSVRVGGIENSTHLQWLDRDLTAGDRLEIRIGDGPCRDEPAQRREEDAEFVAQEERRYYESLKTKYGE